jgi:hypothetical protein
LTQDGPEFVTSSRASPAKALSRSYLSLGSHCELRLGN